MVEMFTYKSSVCGYCVDSCGVPDTADSESRCGSKFYKSTRARDDFR